MRSCKAVVGRELLRFRGMGIHIPQHLFVKWKSAVQLYRSGKILLTSELNDGLGLRVIEGGINGGFLHTLRVVYRK